MSQPAPSSTGTRTLITPKPLVGQELHEAIRVRVNHYMSHENLKKDAFLVSHMNPEMWVDIAVLTSFKGIAMLSATVADVAAAMRESDKVVVSADGKQIKPNIKLPRKTLIIRDIPSETPTQEIEQIFSNFTGAQAPTEIHSEVGDNWFVTFDSEDACVEAHLSLSGKSFNGQPIRARIKSETVAPSFYQPKFAPRTFAPQANVGLVAGSAEASDEVMYFDPNTGAVYTMDPTTGNLYPQSNRMGRDRRGQGSDGGRGGAKKGKKKRTQPPQYREPLQLGTTHFPPLPTKQDLRDAGKTDNSGYGPVTYARVELQQAYQVFNSISAEVANAPRPNFLTECVAVLETAQLTHKLHSFTNEETADVFVQVDQTPDKRGMSPFISPMFISVNTSVDLPDIVLPPAATFAQPHAPPKSASLAPARTAKQVLTSGIRAPPRPGPPLPGVKNDGVRSKVVPPTEASTPSSSASETVSTTEKPAEKPSEKPTATPSAPAQGKKAKGPAASSPAKSKPVAKDPPKSEDKKTTSSFKDALLAPKSNPEKRAAQE